MTSVADIRLAAPRPGGLHIATWRDWSCLVRLVVSDGAALDPAAAHLRDLMGRVEAACSRFRPDSELSRINASAARTHTVSPTLARLVDVALTEQQVSGGLVDPALGADLVRLGYDRDISQLARLVPAVSQPKTASTRRASGQVALVGDRLTLPEGVQLDLGATGKAHTADWAAHEIATRFGCDVLVELGGDIALGGTPRDWQITTAEKAGRPGQRITLRHGGIATSTTMLRAWQHEGRQRHHIIDPRTGEPADGPWRTVTVVAANATRANTLSTAAIIAGDRARDLLREHGASARLISTSGSAFGLGDWPVAS